MSYDLPALFLCDQPDDRNQRIGKPWYGQFVMVFLSNSNPMGISGVAPICFLR